jgi:hypothetical protein
LSANLSGGLNLHFSIDTQANIGDGNYHEREYRNHEAKFNGSSTGGVCDGASECTPQPAACLLNAPHERNVCWHVKLPVYSTS